MPGAEAFTILALIEARDRASEVFARIDEGADKLAATLGRAAGEAEAAGKTIDESLLQTASGTDAAELANVRLAAAREKLTAATTRQAEAERALVDAQASIATEEELASAADAVAAADEKATLAATELKAAKSELSAMQKAKASEDELAGAAKALELADRRAAEAATELTAAQERQAALVTNEDVVKAADALTVAEKRASTASKELTTAEKLQSDTAAAVAVKNGEAAASTDAAAAAQAKLGASSAESSSGLGGIASAAGKVGLGLAFVGGVAVKAAGNFQELMTRTVTSAGASQTSLQQMSSAVLQMAVQTGTSSSELAKGLYMVNSAGYQGAAGLNVLRASTEGARAEGADLATVSNAVTTALNAYHLPASAAVSVTDQLVATVSHGKTTMEALSGAIAQVLPVAASAKLSLSEVGGAMATMTGQGMSADQAAQDLKNTINALQNPNQTAINEMQQMGLSANDVAQHLGQRGLTGTIGMLTQAITSHMGKSGMVLMNAFNASKQAAQDANIMIGNLPKTLQGTAQAFLAGSISSKTWRKDLQGLSPVQAHLMQQFATTAQKAHSFNDLLAKGGPAAQTYNAALAKMTGGTTGLTTALMLSGKHAGTFQANAKGVGDAAHTAGKHVDGWSVIQHTFNFKMAQAKQSVESAGIAIGTILLPYVTKIASAVVAVLTPVVSWISHNQALVGLIAAVVGAILLAIGAIKTATVVMGIFNAVMAADPIVLVVVALAALVAGVIYAYTHFKAFRDVVHAVFAWLKTAVSDVIGFVRDHWRLIIAIIGGPFGLAVALITKYWSDIKRWFFDGVHAVEGILSWFGKLPGMLWGWLSSAASWVARGIDNIVNWFAGLPGRVWTWLSQLGSDAVNAGVNVMIGLYNGLVSMGSWLYNHVLSLVKSVIPGPILSALGISSPSKWAHWAGQMVGQGLANGILASHAAVARASQSLARAVTGTAAGTLSAGLSVTGSLTGAPGLVGAGAATGGTVVNINVTGNHISSQQDADQLAQTIGRHLATTLLPGGGVRIAG